MPGLNLHHIVRGAIQRVNPDSPTIIYVSTGAGFINGIATQTFEAVPARVQVQALSHESLHHLNGLQSAKALRSVHAYGNFSTVNRPAGTGGDLLQLGGEWWAIQHVLEWWPGWCSFAVTQQLNAATVDELMRQIANGELPELTP